ncbi:MAG TPA: type II secretion system F family protein [Stellaceae bacterium]|nr:type II secretion system F family protein [Stellaceae bacterium]
MASIGLSPAALVIAALLLLALTSALGLVIAHNTGPRARLRARVAAIAGAKGSGMAAKAAAPGARRTRQIRSKIEEAAAGTGKPSRGVELRLLIDRAGIGLDVRRFYLWSAAAAAAGSALYLLLGYPWYGLWAPPVLLGAGLPRKVLGMIAARRQRAFTRHFADAIDVIVRGIRSGLPVGECLTIIAREAADPVATEFKLLVEAQRLGMTMKQALDRSCRRMPTADMKFFAIVLNLQQQTGGNLAETLGGLSDVLRQRKKMADKVRAMSSEARTTAGIIGAMPFLIMGIIAIIDPEYISLLFTDPLGKKIVVGGGLWMVLGVLIMRKMISFEI